MAKNLSDAMLAVLRNLEAGREGSHGLTGRSAFGAYTGSRLALLRRGLIEVIMGYDQITPAGREAARTGRHG